MFSIQILLLPILTLLPGYSLLSTRYPEKTRLSFVLFASVAVSSVFGLVLMSLGQFSPSLIAGCELPFLLLRWRSGAWPKLSLTRHALVLSLVAALSVFAFLTSGEPFDGNGDAGVYTISALHLLHTRSWTWDLNETLPKEGSLRDLAISRRAYVKPWDEVAPGFLVRGEKIVPQFFPIFPMWGAIFGSALPAGNDIQGILLASAFGMLMLFLAAERLFGLFLSRFSVAIALILLAGNPLLLIFLKNASAECFLSGLLAGQILFTVLFLKNLRRKDPLAWMSLLPAGLLALAILTKFFAWAVGACVFLVLLMLPVKRWVSALPFPLLVAGAVAIAQQLAGPHLANHFGQLKLLTGFTVVAVAGCLFVPLRALWFRISGWAGFAMASGFVGLLVFLWASGAVVRTGPGHFVHDFIAINGFIFLAAAIVGLLISSRRYTPARFLPALIFVLLTSYLVLGSGDTIFYPFAARRFLVVTVPLGCLYAARFLGSRSRLIALVGTLLVLLPPLVIQRDALLVRPGRGFLSTLKQLDEAIGDQPVLATPGTWRYAAHLLLNRGRASFCTDTQRGRHPIETVLRKYPSMRLLTDSRVSETSRRIARENRPVIRQTTLPPLTKASVVHFFFLTTLQKKDLVARRDLEIGTNDGFLIRNFFAPEQGGATRYRWSGPRASIRMRNGEAVRFTWSAGSNPEKPLPVALFANHRRIGEARITRGWSTSPWYPLNSGGEELLLEIHTHGFQPANLGNSGDQRLLGLRLARVEIRPFRRSGAGRCLPDPEKPQEGQGVDQNVRRGTGGVAPLQEKQPK